ncbi:hypothetical protein N7474_004466 [Penicillium riverlandense]|uniref:uncharacterized protein n=1 Tax=Penicillium riverlandense TaxID=1903569 RepID=UPI002546BB1F|nr:uncharacterized protein N7474_004466 [Penicillium riverlandense]KAJ5818875.1 hypothetical protein N7474_004466 [Penicillium riverlandense]
MASKRQKDLLAPLPPAFPLSSPITEEVPSPPCSSSEDHELERTRPFEFLVKATRQRSQRRKEGHRSVNFSHRDRDGKRVSIGGIMKKNVAKPVGLNLVTDFSQTGSTATPRAEGNAAPFVDLNDLKLLSQAREKERSAQRQKGKAVSKKKQTTTAGGFYRLPDEGSVDVDIQQDPAGTFNINAVNARLEANPNNPFRDQYEVSPSDLNVVIGLTVPSNEALHLDRLKRRDPDSAGDQATTPLTPSIIVTPACEEAPWQTPSPETQRPRATSSIYSRPTTIFEHSQSDIPPVPAIPALHAARKIDTNPPSSTRNRSLSTGTIFEEDSPQEKKPSRLSVNTESNRPLSQGWWTYLLSPLLSRSNTFSSKKSPTSPGFSISPRTVRTKGSTKDWWEKEVSCFSPETPEAVAPSSWEKNLEQSRSLSGDVPEVAAVVPTNRDNMMSMMFPGRPMQGLAAEYYQACAHELFSKTPFFECQGHVCSIAPVNILSNDKAVVDVPGDRGLALVEVDSPNAGLHGRGVPAEKTKTATRGLLIDVDSPRPNNEDTKGATQSPVSATSTDSWASTVVDTPEQDKSLSQTKGFIEEPPVVPQPRFFESEKRAPTPVAAPPPQIINTFSPPVNNVHYPPPVAQPPFQPAPVMEKEALPYGPVYPPGHGTPLGQQATPNSTWIQEHSRAPEPVSPGFQQQTEGTRSIPMNDMQVPAPAYTQYQRDDALPPRYALHPSPGAAVMDPTAPRGPGENHRRRLEREDAIGRQVGGLWRGRGPVSKRGCFGRPGREGRLRRRWYFGICIFFFVIVTVAISLALTLTKHGDTTPVQSQWLNLTGYPPMPTGITTIAGPEPQVQRSACIAPTSLWSCALPKGELQSANMPYAANNPNFRVEIRFLNGTYNHSTTVNTTSTLRVRRDSGSFDPSPSPPSLADQTFLGNTTDGNAFPYPGEDTPFYMTIMSPAQVSSNALFRRSPSSSTSSETFNLSDIIPAPDETSDGLPAAATLYPLPDSQPVRLYNRGMSTEHYGFYTYFDKSIFLESESPLNGGTSDTNANDNNGGSAQSSAKVRCTWSQTRFLVQIWTQPGKLGYNLISSGSTGTGTGTGTSTPASSTPTATSTTPTSSSSATDFTRPGSFPYPVTLTVDRHGGNEDQKLVYCYGVEEDGHYNVTNHKLEIEDRSAGGTLINPAGSSEKGGSYGGVDGGTGGCECQWTNWIRSV